MICVIGSGLNPEPSSGFCPLDWIGLFIKAGAFSGPSCSGDRGVEPFSEPELSYGSTWSRGAMTCRSGFHGLHCEDASGNGFDLATAGYEILGKEAAARRYFPALRSLARSTAQKDAPGHVRQVLAPELATVSGCGEMQGAIVPMTFSGSQQATYTACFVSGSWFITSGPDPVG